MLYAVDLHEDFIDKEGIAVASMPPFQSTCINGFELNAPKTDRFSGYSDTPFGEQVFDIAMAEVESIVEPDCITDNVGRDAVALTGIFMC